MIWTKREKLIQSIIKKNVQNWILIHFWNRSWMMWCYVIFSKIFFWPFIQYYCRNNGKNGSNFGRSHTHTHTKTQNCPLSTWGGIVWFHFFALVRKNYSIESEQKKNWTKNRLPFDRQIGNHYPSLLMFAFWLLMTFFSSSLFSFFPLFDINARRKRNRKRKKIKRIKLTMKKKMCYPDLQWWTTTNWSAKTKVPLNIHSSIAHLHSTQSLTTLNIFLYNEQQQQQKKRENNSPKHREIYSSKWNTH